MYTVNILNNGEWVAPGTVIYLHAFGRHDPVKIVQNFYLVQGGGQTVLIDTGIDNLEGYLSEEQVSSFVSSPSRTTESLLREAGVTTEEVDVLILTHLHFDHYLNASLFPNARIIVNRQEWLYVMMPENQRYAPRSGFPREIFGWLANEAWERLELVEGEVEVLPGIRVIWTGGHSPGHQIVTVDTTQGTVIIPGDEIYMYENLEENIPIGYYYNFENVVAAMDLIRRMEAIVLPAHDPKVHERYPTMQIGELQTAKVNI
jgi:glyoxylase-like metal-dependent hydrolase (beta-lactamase superfamily II)